MGRALAFGYGIASYSIFFVTFLYLIGFMANLWVPKGIDDGVASSTGLALAINAALVVLFGLQHSVMARPGFKAAWTRIVPHPIERSTYVLLSSAVLILLMWQWRPLPAVIWSVESPLGAMALQAIFFGGIGLVLLSTFVIDHFDLFGLRQTWLHLVDRPYRHPRFQVTWFYRFIRHPLYLGWILSFWATPVMSVGHLLFAIGMTAYIFSAIPYEERDLEHYLGEDYRRYRERVPMLVPKLGQAHETVKDTSGAPITG